jgi:DNA-binding HxlR family transcriptional regulator
LGQDFRSDCPIASTLDVIGDKWSLLVIRNMMLGATSFREFLGAPEKIATNILSERLVRLQAHGLIVRVAPTPGTGSRRCYRLTAAGADLLPILQAAANWGEAHLTRRKPTPKWFRSAVPADVLLDSE